MPPAKWPEPVDGARWIHLSGDRFALVDESDYERANSRLWRMGQHYATSREGPTTTLLLHRFILGLGPGDMGVDHRNRNKLDCRRMNLRLADQRQNNANMAKRRGLSSRFKGVHFDRTRGKWMARISINNKGLNLGRFDTEEDAARAYDAKAREIQGEFAVLNFAA